MAWSGPLRLPSQQVYRKLRIEPWVNHRPYPRELLPWTEGSTQVDVEISWENPPTTVFVEAKYQSELGKTTSNSGEQSEYPTDQLIRNVRVGLYHCGYFARESLFDTTPRDFVVLLLSPASDSYLVRRYRNQVRLLKSIPHSDRLKKLPRFPFVGEVDYAQINQILLRRTRFFSRAERELIRHLTTYLDFKRETMRPKSTYLQELKLWKTDLDEAGIGDSSNREEPENGQQKRSTDQKFPGP